jgi:hypothetical protein
VATAASPSGRQRQTNQCSLRQAHLCTLLCLHGKGQLPAELLHSDVCDRAFLPRQYTPNVCATVRGGVGELTRSVNWLRMRGRTLLCGSVVFTLGITRTRSEKTCQLHHGPSLWSLDSALVLNSRQEEKQIGSGPNSYFLGALERIKKG